MKGAVGGVWGGGGRCRELCWGVGEVRKDVWVGVWESVWGE